MTAPRRVALPALQEFIPSYSPDVVGLQECDVIFREFLPQFVAERGLNYELILAGFTSVLYNKDTLELLETEYLIYPETMDEHKGPFNNDNSKSTSVSAFRVKESGKVFIFANTHLWWMNGNEGHPSYRPFSHEARRYQMNLMIELVNKFRAKYNCPAFMVGDMNATYDSLAIQHALASGFRHAHDIATDFADERNGWHYCFPDRYELYDEPKPFKEGIDHILVTGEPEGFVKRFERYTPDWYMPLSDHFPVFADVEL